MVRKTRPQNGGDVGWLDADIYDRYKEILAAKPKLRRSAQGMSEAYRQAIREIAEESGEVDEE